MNRPGLWVNATLLVIAVLSPSARALATGAYYSDVPHYNQAWFTGSGDCSPNSATQVLGWHDAHGWSWMIPGGDSHTDNEFSSNPDGVTQTMDTVKEAMDWWNWPDDWVIWRLWFDKMGKWVRDAAQVLDPAASSWWVDDDDLTSWSDMRNQINNYGPMMFWVVTECGSSNNARVYYGTFDDGSASDYDTVCEHSMCMLGYSEGVYKVNATSRWIIVDTGWSRTAPAWLNYDAPELGDCYTVEIRALGTPTPPPTISRSPTSLSPSCDEGQDNARAEVFAIWNSGGGMLSYEVSVNNTWLWCNPSSGVTSGLSTQVTVNYRTGSLAAGTHSATITIKGSGATNNPQTVSVNLTVRPKPGISRLPTYLSNSCGQGQNAPSQSFEVWNSGGGTLSYSITDNVTWLSCTPTSGTSTGEHDPITVNYSTSGLGSGNYSATITISDANASNSPRTIAVSLTVTQKPAISRQPTSLSNSCGQGQNAPSQSFEVWNSGGGTLSYSITDNAAWLSCTPTSGTSTGEHDPITANYSTSGLASGSYSATITISDPNASNSPQFVSVELTVYGAQKPSISRQPTSLTNSCTPGQNASSQSFDVWNSGGGTLSYSIADNAAWLSCTPTSGTSMGEQDPITVNYSTSGLVVGDYSATITISDPNASNTPQIVGVSLNVGGPPPQVEVAFAVDPSGKGLELKADEEVFTDSRTFTWNKDSTHTIEAPSPQTGNDGQSYTFSRWSDAGARSHDVKVTGHTRYTAFFRPVTEGFETGDFSAFRWVTSGDAEWFVQSDEVYEGSYTAQSGAIIRKEASTLELTVPTLDGRVEFVLKVSSDGVLEFFIDGEERGQWWPWDAGDWVAAAYDLCAGLHTFRWTYYKTSYSETDETLGRAWLDQITIPLAPDADKDLLPDAWEQEYFGSTTAGNPADDLDNDRLTNLQEFAAGTHPKDGDTDDDGLPDGWEVKWGRDALVGGIPLPGIVFNPVGSYAGYALDVAVVGNLAFVADGSSGLQVLNVGDPANITLAGSYACYAEGVTVAGNLAFVAGSSGLWVLNVGDPANITLAGSYDTPGYAWDVAVAGNLAFVADEDSGLQVLNVGDPADITLAGSYDTPGDARGVAVAGNLAFVADYHSGLQVLNVGNPANITLAGSYDTPGYARRVAVAGNLAFVADYHSGLQVLNVGNPANITLAGSYDTPGYAGGVAVVGNLAFVAAGSSGLQVLQYEPVDNDSDGMQVFWEIEHGLNPDDPSDASRDKDLDGLTNLQEFLARTNPELADSDGDGLSDYDEIFTYCIDPASADSDRDGLGDRDELNVYGTDPGNSDTDHDGANDRLELVLGRNPKAAEPLGSGTMRGHVWYEDHVVPSRVTARGNDGTIVGLAWWDDNGMWHMSRLISGTYYLKVEAAGLTDMWWDAADHRDTAAALPFGVDEIRENLDFVLKPGESPAFLDITSNPSGADIILNDMPIGNKTPVVMQMDRAGTHWVRVFKLGYPMSSVQVVGAREAETTPVHFDLTAGKGSIRVSSTPAGAEAILNGTPMGENTETVLGNLLPGSHLVAVRKDGSGRVGQVRVEVEAGKESKANFELTSDQVGSLHVSSLPAEAKIILDGILLGQVTDVQLDNLAAGSHSIRVFREGFVEPEPRAVWIGTGETTELCFGLIPLRVTSTVNDGIPDAWKKAYGLSTTDAGLAGKDLRGDGVTVKEAFVCGLDPTDKTSIFNITHLEVWSSDQWLDAEVSWNSVPGRCYVIEAAEEAGGPWFPVSGIITATRLQSDHWYWTEAEAPTTKLFYRVYVIPPW
jgi:hypothetical protein